MAISDDELRDVIIGDLAPLTAPIALSDPDPRWPDLFARERERVYDILGPVVLRLEHVGSTSVPGLAAKPIIDLLLVVPDSADEPAYAAPLERAGYVLRVREPDWFEHRLLKGPDTDINLHVFSAGCPEVDRMLAFRDWLRAHDDDRELYERTKRELASQDWKFVQNYADAKTAVVREIMARASAG
ncbi:GrpB family protein [Actinokineospora sp. NBRC 105648]|uniref:GrpB family protein n=1 Tax=Actinokineospora sp. NBRC 105648 TaxID=3032206 RepID=UPI0024A048F7|nr:GrpB family protein [Actinokineospora sp. NBRC 105648]GLZ36809.1 hypothetical protein Acsp05_04340 [Actinokineospora sp. NBRC 105648]